MTAMEQEQLASKEKELKEFEKQTQPEDSLISLQSQTFLFPLLGSCILCSPASFQSLMPLACTGRKFQATSVQCRLHCMVRSFLDPQCLFLGIYLASGFRLQSQCCMEQVQVQDGHSAAASPCHRPRHWCSDANVTCANVIPQFHCSQRCGVGTASFDM